MWSKHFLLLGLSLSLPLVHAAPFVSSSTPSIGTNLNHVHNKRQFATFGPHLSLGQTDSEFIKMTTTFIPGHPPAMMVGSLFIWPGLFDQKNRSDGDLIQTVAEFTDRPKMVQTCNAGAGQWQAPALIPINEATCANSGSGVSDPSLFTRLTYPKLLRMANQ
jgi:hypothetical protein